MTLRRLAVRRVAIERGDGPIVEQLLAERFEVVVLSPRQVRSLRARYGTAGNNDDRLDAFVLADAVRTDAGRWKPVQPDFPATVALRMQVRTRRDLVAHRIAVHNHLLAVLQQHFPNAVGLFSGLDIPISLAFLGRFPTQADAAWLTEARMAPGQRLLRPAQRTPAPGPSARGRPRTPASTSRRGHPADRWHAGGTARPTVRPDHRLGGPDPGRHCWPIPTGQSLPPCPVPAPSAPQPAGRAGGLPRPLPRPDRAHRRRRRRALNQAIRQFLRVTFRRGCNQHLRAALVDWAQDTPRANPWARDSYQRARARGCRHPHAARILANAWTRVLWRCWQDQTPYDPHRHRRLTDLTTDLTKKAT